ncbi:MAG: glycosyltransferase [Firmicutes bacterium]|nr:glycosyltransferase [Bacillota bacterium]
MESNIYKNVLFVIPDQFGYSAGYYYYCKYLIQEGFDSVGVICLDCGKPKVEAPEGTAVYYVKAKNALHNRLQMLLVFLSVKKHYQRYIIKQFIGVSIFTFFCKSQDSWLDIRTGSVRKRVLSRFIENKIILLESSLFHKIFILSLPLAKKLNLKENKIVWLPLGADEISKEKKDYLQSMNFLYIGTFYGRNLHQCIEGFAKFYLEYREKINISFDIVGDGPNSDVLRINSVIYGNKLNDIVKLHGELNHLDATALFEKCNFGVSYVPMTDFYQLQPPTKIFEYVLSGLVCIATNTIANRELISQDNGMLHNDDPSSFYEALVKAYNYREHYRTTAVKSTLIDYSWQNIVRSIIIKSITNQVS